MIKLALILIIFTISASASDIGFNVPNQMPIERADGAMINYYILRNSESGSSNVLLTILQGSDCNSVLHIDAIAELKLAWPLADILLIDKYGITSSLVYSESDVRDDCPLDYLKMDSLDQRVSDVLQVLEEIKSRNVYETYLLMGGSEGAVVANIVASKTDLLDATVSFNGGGRWFSEAVIHNMKYGREGSPALTAQIEGFKQMAAKIAGSDEMEIMMSGHGFRWWKSSLQLDQLGYLKQVNSPLLLIQSEDDQSVSIKSADAMMQTLVEYGKQNIEYKKYAGLDHYFDTSNGASKTAEVMVDVKNWYSMNMKDVGK